MVIKNEDRFGDGDGADAISDDYALGRMSIGRQWVQELHSEPDENRVPRVRSDHAVYGSVLVGRRVET